MSAVKLLSRNAGSFSAKFVGGVGLPDFSISEHDEKYDTPE